MARRRGGGVSYKGVLGGGNFGEVIIYEYNSYIYIMLFRGKCWVEVMLYIIIHFIFGLRANHVLQLTLRLKSNWQSKVDHLKIHFRCQFTRAPFFLKSFTVSFRIMANPRVV